MIVSGSGGGVNNNNNHLSVHNDSCCLEIDVDTSNYGKSKVSIMKWLNINSQGNSSKKNREQSLSSNNGANSAINNSANIGGGGGISNTGKRPSSVNSAGGGGKGSGRSLAETATTIVTNIGISIVDV